MEYLVTAEEMRLYDANTTEKIGIPGMVLMERAALAARRVILERTAGRPCRVLVMAGVGNNGGDGLALARLLAERNFPVDVWCVGDAGKASGQWQKQREILEKYDVPLCDNLPTREYTIIVDALFGVGLTRDITGEYAEAVEAFNRIRGFKLALDIPSGIDSDSGSVRGCAVRADVTVTFGFAKRGLYLYPGADHAGIVHVADIGITEKSFLGNPPRMFLQDLEDESLPVRDAAGNKGSFGKVLLIAGEKGMAGAAVLAARAAYRAGCGMARVLTAQENRVILQETVPEALYGTFADLSEGTDWADVIAVGPGLGRSETARAVLESVIRESLKPLLIDADGLNLLAEDALLQGELAAQERALILTPHVGELARLLGRTVPELKSCLWEFGLELAAKLRAVVAAKDARTFVCQEGRPVCTNILGNSGMATAGSGDVLAGAIAGLWAQYLRQHGAGDDPAFRAACQGVLLHAAAGDIAAGRVGQYACMAGDIAEALAEALTARTTDKTRADRTEGNDI